MHPTTSGLPVSFSDSVAGQGEPLTGQGGPMIGQGEADELAWLRQADRRGLRVAPMAVVPVQVEIEFYRLNDLPRRLKAMFEAIDLGDPDEEDIEDLAPAAEALIREHALLDEVIEAFYQTLVGLPAQVEVRRAGADGLTAGLGRPALLALKRTWASAWQPEAMLLRLRRGDGLSPDSRPVLVHGAASQLDARASTVASDVLAMPLRAWTDEQGRLTRLAAA